MIEIDLCNFPAIWAVLSILLDTQSNTLQYVKSLQQAVNNYYDKCPTDFMSRLEHQASDIMKAMYDSIFNDNFDDPNQITALQYKDKNEAKPEINLPVGTHVMFTTPPNKKWYPAVIKEYLGY